MLINPRIVLSTGQLEELAITTYKKYLLTIQSPLDGVHGIQLDEKNFTKARMYVTAKTFFTNYRFYSTVAFTPCLKGHIIWNPFKKSRQRIYSFLTHLAILSRLSLSIPMVPFSDQSNVAGQSL
jgi:hypothetical protein